jgi:biopolymer transport protein ExbD
MNRRRRKEAEPVEPDLPITPMLDMSFQLLSFFIMTFRPAATEAQIAMTLPKDEGSPNAMSFPSPADDRPVKFVVKVEAGEGGEIRSINVKEEGTASSGTDLGADPQALLKELKSINDEKLKGKPGKIVIEIDDRLLQAYVVNLIDAGLQAGFTDISPVPSDPRRR